MSKPRRTQAPSAHRYPRTARLNESLREVIRTYFEAMQKALERHGGTVEKFIGDAVLAIFPASDGGVTAACRRAVAAAEQGLMAGADRVEGCLFGNGERTGNVDIVTLAMNMYTQGVHPGLDFSDINAVVRTAEHCTQLPVHPRHPYAGDLVFTAFSGSHQDAIKKGFAARNSQGSEAGERWNVPYLPIDPADLGRSYDSVIRVNSQSGKGGVAYLLEADFGVVMPRRMQIEFSAVVQQVTDAQGGELSSADIWRIFSDTYVTPPAKVGAGLAYRGHHLAEQDGGQTIALTVAVDGQERVLTGHGNGPIHAAVQALASAGIAVEVHGYEERAMGGARDEGRDDGSARACAIVEVKVGKRSTFGVGVDANIVTACVQALCSGASRAMRDA